MTVFSRFKIAGCAVFLGLFPIGLSLVAVPVSTSVAFADDLLDVAPKQTPAEINNFKLSEDFLSRMEKCRNSWAVWNFQRRKRKDRMPRLPSTRW